MFLDYWFTLVTQESPIPHTCYQKDNTALLKEVVKEDQMGSRAMKQASSRARYSSVLITARLIRAFVFVSLTANDTLDISRLLLPTRVPWPCWPSR